MQERILTSYSGNYFYIDRLDDIIKIAFALKAQSYFVDAISNKIFGFYDERYSIIETNVPFKISNSFFFSAVSLNSAESKELININKTYFTIPEYPYILFPENRRADLMNQNIVLRLDNQTFIDNMTGKVLTDIIMAVDMNQWFMVSKYLDSLNAYFNRMRTLEQPSIFENMNENSTIQEVISSKISQGTKILKLNSGNNQYAFYIFKSLLGPLTKTDKLTIFISPDIIEKNKFKVTFRVYKKKAKIDIPELNDMTIDTHVFMINLMNKSCI